MSYSFWHPSIDLRFPFGEEYLDIGILGPHYVMGALYIPFMVEHIMALPELSIVWRHRSNLTQEERRRPEPGLVVAYLLACCGWLAWMVGTVWLIGFQVFDNYEKFMKENCGGPTCITSHWLAFAYGPALAVAMLASWFQGDQSQHGARALSNRLRVIILSQFSFTFIWIGSSLVQTLYYLFADGLVCPPPSIVFKRIVMLLTAGLCLLLPLGTSFCANDVRDFLLLRICMGQEAGTRVHKRS